MIGGAFNSFDGNATPSHLARLTAYGQYDASFNGGLGADNYVSSIVVQPDGKILVAGDRKSVV